MKNSCNKFLRESSEGILRIIEELLEAFLKESLELLKAALGKILRENQEWIPKRDP